MSLPVWRVLQIPHFWQCHIDQMMTKMMSHMMRHHLVWQLAGPAAILSVCAASLLASVVPCQVASAVELHVPALAASATSGGDMVLSVACLRGFGGCFSGGKGVVAWAWREAGI